MQAPSTSAASQVSLSPQASTVSVYLRDDEVDAEEVIADEALNVTPMPLPPPLPIHIADMHLAARPAKVYELLFKRSSAFRAKIYGIEGAEEMRTSRWSSDPQLAAATGFPDAKTRVITCVRPLRIPLAGANKVAEFRDVQMLLAKSPGGFVVETDTSINAPGTWADFASHRLQWACQADGTQNCKVRLTLNVDIKQDTAAFIESTVRNTTVYHNKQRLKIWVDALTAEVGTPAPTATSSSPGDTLPDPSAPSPSTPDHASLLAPIAGALGTLFGTLAGACTRVSKTLNPRLVAYALLAYALCYFVFSLVLVTRSLQTAVGAMTLSLQPPGQGQGQGLGAGAGAQGGLYSMAGAAGQPGEAGGQSLEAAVQLMLMNLLGAAQAEGAATGGRPV